MVKPSKRGRNPWWVLVVIVIAGAMLGSVLANAIGQFTYLSWLGRSVAVGLAPPVVIDLQVMTLTVGFTLRLNLAILLGILVAAYVFRML
ncbi:MAG TPA: DUF4321 domain-containing protein [bacterium]|nr:DUF4321 domain-containing protein [bacterium]